MKPRVRSAPLQIVTALIVWAHTLPAVAHHPMGGVTPRTLSEGLLSGFGHPVIGPDHLLFIIALGVACHYFGQRLLTIATFLLGALAGTLLHVQMPALPYAETGVAVSLILLGILFFLRHDFLRRKTAILLFALSGVAHGYAYGEAIIGAEATPLLAYLSGFTLAQFALAFCSYLATRYVARQKPGFELLQAAGGTLATVGAGFLVVTLAT